MDDPDLDAPPDDQPPDDPFASLDTGELVDRLCSVAARVAVAECEFLDLLGELDAREGWAEAAGVRSTAHWLSWRVGHRLGVAREKVRVARALRRLPLLRATFGQGRLSYCKGARRVPGGHPGHRDRAGRDSPGRDRRPAGDRGADLASHAARAGRRASHACRGVRCRVADYGSVVFTIRLGPTEAALLDHAIDLARRALLDAHGRLVETPEEQQLADGLTDDPPTVRAEADAVLLLAESFLATGPDGEAGDRHVVLVHADLDALAAAATEESTRTTRVADVSAVARTADVSAEAHTADPSAETPRPAPLGGSSRGLLRPGEPVHQAALARRAPTARVEDGDPVSPATVLRLLCQSSAQLLVRAQDGHALDLGRTQRHADRRQRRVLRVRDGGRCRFPGCTSRSRLVPHHTRWWSRGGRTDLDLLVSLCPAHHLAVHELGYTVRALGRGRFTWHRPDGAHIPDAPILSVGNEQSATAGDTGHPAQHPERDPATHRRSRTDPPTLAPTWGGATLDLDHLLTGWAANLLNAAGHRIPDLTPDQLDTALRDAAGLPPAA